ncbi:MAG: DUF2730 family protein [Desulfobacterales bacterium]|jgi:hypothetical protein|nr:DUF2730 family protein [Desulfobacterales bacterium]
MTRDLAFWALIFNVANSALTFIVGAFVWLMKRAQISIDRFRAVEHGIGLRLDDHDQRLIKVEAACGYAPTHTDLGKMYARMNDISGQVKQLTGGVDALKASVELIHEHLLNGGR